MSFRLNPQLDADALHAAYARDGRVRIADFLNVSDAEALRRHLTGRTDWRQVMNSGDKVFELDRPTLAAMDAAKRDALDDAVMAGARAGFQYRYETVRVADGVAERAAAGDPLNAFAEWMSGAEALAFLRAVTGAADAVFADAQATAYAPGDFLTAHDDGVAGKDRRAAYVFGLNPRWRPEWGGLLLFHDGADRVAGVSPAFNTLDLLAVPQPHSVSQVTRAAPSRRYAVTGWLRAQAQPR
ncbi:2OG-Fe(II) oxygenase family protein [Sphingomonas sp. KR1UV-12]|uniref:2OG-Fe(II) oxygenase family protein n=1 Tax=Sphingomonas aurea TaxID=3063994 RepID=A0ABT9EKM1_9SPHN|nr:2OG-Fe(II) oxygenase family protein [Sphingomonas sp. KR1UV-12]MDP1027510.1 2OG-Fe(II) oxygenase family protein [Sphingomonas sp. KR1UV-12]